MATMTLTSRDETRARFSRAMSEMYRAEAPRYGALLELVSEVNEGTLRRDPNLEASLDRAGELDRLSVERHGAIRVGTAQELFEIAKVFAVMGMRPVGYYDLSVAGLPVHSTAFRPVDDAALRRNPFRIFTSLLRLELIKDEELRAEAAAILAARKIFTPRAAALVAAYEREGGLTAEQAESFVREALETFRWNGAATISAEAYQRLLREHRLIADIVSFRGPHINHLTPRTLDIDAAHARMAERGIAPKALIEGPPRRNCAILLRQTSYKAVEEPIVFANVEGGTKAGVHAARFGEIEQRGAALTPKGRKIYDELLSAARSAANVETAGVSAEDYEKELARQFKALPDDWSALRAERLAFFRYSATKAGIEAVRSGHAPRSVEALISDGFLQFDPIVYEDFLPVSAAGIFQSNLGGDAPHIYSEPASRVAFEAALGQPVLDEMDLYRRTEAESLDAALADLGLRGAASPSPADGGIVRA